MPFDVLQLLLEVNAARRAGRRDASAAEHELERRFACAAWLASYGSLAPGGTNHGELAHCPGTWWQGTVTGHRAERQWPVFTFTERGPRVPVWLLHSRELPTQWQALDAFEGDDYRRILVPVWHGDQLFAVANLYEAVIPVTPAEARP